MIHRSQVEYARVLIGIWPGGRIKGEVSRFVDIEESGLIDR